MPKIERKQLELSILCGLLCAVLLCLSGFSAACDGLRSGVLRLHIIANSDSDTDQAVKLLVRDRILDETGTVFGGCDNLDDAICAAECDIENIAEYANNVLKENGFSYTATAEVGESYFETRHYDTFSLPAGTYKSLIVRLGKAEGKNWWCVVFPAVCLPAAADTDFSAATDEKSAKIAENPDRYVIRFKAVEIYEDIKRFFNS